MNDSDFERLLNGVLREDAQVEPLQGLEKRVMARIRIEPQRRSVWWMMAFGAASVGLAVWFGVVSFSPQRRTSPPPQLETAIRERVSPPALGLSVSSLAAHDRKPEQRRQTRPPEVLARMSGSQEIAETGTGEVNSLPKLDVFPTPSPVPEPVRELVAVSLHEGAVAGLAGTSSGPAQPAELKIEPLTIARIEIAPLNPLTDAKGNEVGQ
jgi:hypothetical protein